MPVLELRMAREFELFAGVTRGRVPDPERAREQARELSADRKRIKRQQRQIRQLQEKEGLTQPDTRKYPLRDANIRTSGQRLK
jgi:hypothetical protein